MDTLGSGRMTASVVEDDWGESLVDDALFLGIDERTLTPAPQPSATTTKLFIPNATTATTLSPHLPYDDYSTAPTAAAATAIAVASSSLRTSAVSESLRRRLHDDNAITTTKTTMTTRTTSELSPIDNDDDNDDDDDDLDEGSLRPRRLTKRLHLNNPDDSTITTTTTTASTATVPVSTLQSSYGLPTEVYNAYLAERRIERLYDWQHRCLSIEDVAVKRGRNLVVMTSTSSGKTLIAEIMLLRCLLQYRENAIFILPFISLVEEKYLQLEPLAKRLGFALEAYAGARGRLPPRKHRGTTKTLYIATIEKGNALINHFIEKGSFSTDFGLVAVDELHMLDEDGGRGTILEGAIAKVLYSSTALSLSSGLRQPRVQVIGMSATIGNIEEIAAFLHNAHIFRENFRPIQLNEHIIFNGQTYIPPPTATTSTTLTTRKPLISLSSSPFWPWTEKLSPNAEKHPPDNDPSASHLFKLITDVYQTTSCLVFCATRDATESIATRLATILLPSPAIIADNTPSQQLLQRKREELIITLRRENDDLYKPELAHCLQHGVAFHHAGLTAKERTLVERAYLDRVISVIVCTTTLAAGVNLPAGRVIIRSPELGDKLLSKSRYLQMIGRAGRTGYDSNGDSFVFLSKQDQIAPFMKMLTSPIDDCHSQMIPMLSDRCERLVLESICCKLFSSLEQAADFYLHSTLSAQQWAISKPSSPKTPSETLEFAKMMMRLPLMRLCDMHLLKKHRDIFTPDERGYAAFNAGIPPILEAFVYRDLTTAAANLSLIGDFHMLYVISPVLSAMRPILKAIPTRLRDYLDKKDPDGPLMKTITQKIEISIPDLQRVSLTGMVYPSKFLSMYDLMVAGYIRETTPIDKAPAERLNEKINRLYTACVLHYITTLEHTVVEAADRFGCKASDIYDLMNAASVYTSQLGHYCGKVAELWQMGAILSEMPKRILLGASRSNAPLMQIQGITVERARILASAGFTDAKTISKVEPREFIRKLGTRISENALLRIREAAQQLVEELAEELREDAEDLISSSS